MNLINFIDYLVSPEKINVLLSNLKVNKDSEALIICLKDNLSLNSEIAIFGIEETEGDLEFEKNGNKYHYLLEVFLAKEFIEDWVASLESASSYEDIAKKLYEYGINDA